MITDALIKKLDLRESPHWINQSKLLGLKIFTWPDVSDNLKTVLFMECEVDGTAMTEKNATVIMVRTATAFKWCRVTEELLNDVDGDEILKIMAHKMKSCPELPHNARRLRLN